MAQQTTKHRQGVVIAGIALATVFVSAPHLRAQDGDVVVRASIDAPEGIFVGQRVRLRLDVLGSDGWASLPQLPRVDVPGAITYTPQSQGLRLNETIGGESYSGQQYELWLYPQRTGTVDIPVAQLDVSVKAFGVNARQDTRRLNTEPIQFEVGVPPGIDPGIDFVCTAAFTARQNWRPDSSQFQVGDGITRLVTRTIADAPGMVLTPLAFPAVPGIRLYPKQPAIDDSINRGEIAGKRTDAATYVFQKAGDYELPETRFAWWDTGSGQLREETLPGLTVTVAPAPAATAVAEDAIPTGRRPSSNNIWIVVIAVLAFSAIYWRYGQTLITKCREYAARVRASEWSTYRRFRRAARTNDAQATLRELMHWLDRLQSVQQPARLDRFLEEFGDAGSRDAAGELIRVAQLTEHGTLRGRHLIDVINPARRRYLASRSRKARRAIVLPALNPHKQRADERSV